MPKEDDFSKQLIATFKTELDEKLQIITDGLFALEKKSKKIDEKKIIEEIFRAGHNIKGSARSVGIVSVGEIAHEIESLFASIQTKEVKITPKLINLCLMAVDAMRSAMDSFLNNKPLSFDLEDLIKSLQQGKPLKSNELPKIAEFTPDVNKNPESSEYESIRVPLLQIDNVSALVEQMQTNRIAIEEQFSQFNKLATKLKHLARQTEPNPEQLSEISHLMEKLSKTMHNNVNELTVISNSLQEEVRRLRLVPASTLLRQLIRSVRDLSLELHKKVEFEIKGDQVKMDKMILEGLKDPLIHILRNAIDHGIEDPKTRKALGKSEFGNIRIDVIDEGSQILINIADDGAGVNTQKITDAALKKNIITQSDLNNMDEQSISELIFRPEFSTKEIITDISGRGVGLDVVKANLSELKGKVSFSSQLGKGTCFHLRLPLTLSSDIGLTVKSGGQLFVIPTSAVEHVMILKEKDIHDVEASQIVLFNKKPVPISTLSSLLKIEQFEMVSEDRYPVVILKKGWDRIALLVDEIIGEREIVIKSLNAPLTNVPCVAGGTLLGTGEVIIVLNAGDLVHFALHSGLHRVTLETQAIDETLLPHILLADDSITTRTLEKNILENNNYKVTVAVDGKEAWDLLQKQHFSLLITDIEMPNMDGFDLTERIKQSDRFREIPVIIVTSLDSDEQKKRGIEVGANAYIVKHDFESTELLEIVGQLV